MNILEAIEFFKNRHLTTLKRSTNMGYLLIFNNLRTYFDGRAVESITPDDIGQFLESFTASFSKRTRHLRYAQAKAFFNFVINECGLNIKNPCEHSLLAKQFKNPKSSARKILDKELVDEMIYSTSSQMDRLILELQARCGLRIGEVLKLSLNYTYIFKDPGGHSAINGFKCIRLNITVGDRINASLAIVSWNLRKWAMETG